MIYILTKIQINLKMKNNTEMKITIRLLSSYFLNLTVMVSIKKRMGQDGQSNCIKSLQSWMNVSAQTSAKTLIHNILDNNLSDEELFDSMKI